MGVIAVTAVMALLGAAAGRGALSSSHLGSWVHRAKKGAPPRRHPLTRLAWCGAPAIATAAAGAAASSGTGWQWRPGSVVLLLALASWAAVLALLALIDAEQLVLPSPLARLGVAALGTGLAVAGAAAGDWSRLASAGAATLVAVAAYGLWRVLSSSSIGLGDVRMAGLVAMGIGSFSLPASLVAVSCAPLAAGLLGRGTWARWRVTGERPGAVPLGPFLAGAGVIAVVACAR